LDLKFEVKELLEEMAFSSALVAAEQRLALALLQVSNVARAIVIN